ncbi:hypothetical protein ACFU99_00725 [Streptomyces sp. NPDC057654]|uniref:hypothetical protein n=1 Tax=Streptomyces sp. NPDC057654 TaxID=3346196 RepID=UPI003691EF59
MATQAAKKNTTAKKAEATDSPTEIEFQGLTLMVQAKKKLPLDLLEAIEDDRGEVQIIRAILGPDQWATFKTLNPTIEDFEDLATRVADAAGFGDSGN